jgi:hypothetical protein
MGNRLDWETLYRAARENVRPTYRRLRRMDRDDWLAKVGLERRNIAVDVAAASGFILLGCAIGFGVGLLLAPKPGSETRRDLNRRVRDTAERMGINKEQQQYAS